MAYASTMTLKIDTDASAYTAVVIDDDYEGTPAGANAQNVKILQSDVDAGEDAECAISGETFGEIGSSVSAGDNLETDSNSKLVTASGAGTHNVCAEALEAGSTGRVKINVVNKQITIS